MNRSEILYALSDHLEVDSFQEVVGCSDADLWDMFEFPDIARLFAMIRVNSECIESIYTRDGTFSLFEWLRNKRVLSNYYADNWVHYYVDPDLEPRHIKYGNLQERDMKGADKFDKTLHSYQIGGGWKWYRSICAPEPLALNRIIMDPLIDGKIAAVIRRESESGEHCHVTAKMAFKEKNIKRKIALWNEVHRKIYRGWL